MVNLLSIVKIKVTVTEVTEPAIFFWGGILPQTIICMLFSNETEQWIDISNYLNYTK